MFLLQWSQACRSGFEGFAARRRVQDTVFLLLFRHTENPIKLETGLRPNSAGIPYTLLLRIEAIGFPTFGLLL